MLFINYDIGAMQPRLFPQQTPYLEVAAAGSADAYKGRQMNRISRIVPKHQGEAGFSSILAEEEDAILTRLAV